MALKLTTVDYPPPPPPTHMAGCKLAGERSKLSVVVCYGGRGERERERERERENERMRVEEGSPLLLSLRLTEGNQPSIVHVLMQRWWCRWGWW